MNATACPTQTIINGIPAEVYSLSQPSQIRHTEKFGMDGEILVGASQLIVDGWLTQS